jgi:sugar O-acyltransferase (sialic acid O-acetyltransferase NeuD family)
MDKPVIVFGNGQMARMLHFYLTHDSEHTVAAFTVNRDHLREPSMLGLEVAPFESIEHTHPPDKYTMCIPISYRQINQMRAAKYHEAKARGYNLISYVSTRAITWPGLVIGDNCIILEGAVVQPSAQIGNDVFLGCGSIVSHDCVVGDHCFVAPGCVALGYVRIGRYCVLGANSTIRDGVTVAEECVIGAGVTIGRDTGPQEVYIGERAHPEKKRSSELRQWVTWGR